MVRQHRFLLLITLSLSLCGPSAAQSRDRADLTGRVSDESGAALAGVAILLRNAESGHVHATVTNVRGDFVYPFLAPGTYRLTAEIQGFSPLTFEAIRLAVNQSLQLPVILKVGGPDTRVTVTGRSNAIETDNPAVKYSLRDQQVQDLPIYSGSDGRHVLTSIGFLLPGASNGNYANVPNLNALSINGSPTGGVGFSFDGMDSSSMGNWTFGIYTGGALNRGPNPDAVQEVSALTQNYGAESGLRSVLINLETRSGTNEFRGQARIFRADPALAARDFFDTEKKSSWTTSGAGFQLTGPVRLPGLYDGNNRTLFFVDLEGTRSRLDAGSAMVYTLTDLERLGDFSESPVQQWPIDPRTGAVFPRGKVPSDRILPQSRRYVDEVIARADQGREILATSRNWDGNTQLTTRVDQQFSSSHTTNLGFFYESGRSRSESVPWVQDMVTRVPISGWNLAVHYTHVLTPAAVNSIAFGAGNGRHRVLAEGRYDDLDLKQEGFNITRQTVGPVGLPNVSIEGINDFRPGTTEYAAAETPWSAKDDFSLSRGLHTIKAGAELRWLCGNAFDNDIGVPSFSFSPYNPDGTGNAIADLLLGVPARYSQSTDATNYPRRRHSALYFQDDIKLRANLTVNLGIRYELTGAWSERDGRNAMFRPGSTSGVFPLAPAGVLFAGDHDPMTGSIIDESLTPVDHDDLAPRIGVAYSPGWGRMLFGGAARSSIRAGYGIYYVFSRADAVRSIANMPPWYFRTDRDQSQISAAGGGFADPWGTDPDPFAAPLTDTAFPSPLSNVPFVDLRFSSPYEQQWTLSLQRQLPWNVVAEAAYIGSRAVHLPRQFEANPGRLTANATPLNVNSRRQYPEFGATPGYASDGSSAYHGMQLAVNRRFASHLQFSASYTVAKSLDDAGGALFADRDVVHWARSDFDRLHKLVGQAVWQVPRIPAGKHLGAVVSGWQLNWLVHLNSGTPINIRNLYDPTLRGSLQGWPDIVGPFRKLNPREVRTFLLPNGQTNTGSFLFDPSVFRTVFPRGAQEARAGTLVRNAFTGHGICNIDLSVLKRFSMGEHQRLEVRADVTNLFNHAQFVVPFPGAVYSPSFFFGITNRTMGPRRIQLLLRYSF